MTMPRSSIVSLDETPWYHCVSRCVRRAFLCGKDKLTGKDFSHRRGWIAERIKKLSEVFCIHVAGYAVMSNHYHVILYVDRDMALSLDDREVIERWTRLFQGTDVMRKFMDGEELIDGERDVLLRSVEEIRGRLYSLSWYMRTLNEYVARLANKEDGARGRFWEGRYKSQALLDEKALLAALAYVDLNPVRAGIAKYPEESEFTSVYERIEAMNGKKACDERLMPFKGNVSDVSKEYGPSEWRHSKVAKAGSCCHLTEIPYEFHEYLELVDWTARHIRKEGLSHVDVGAPTILKRLGIEPKGFLELSSSFLKEFGHAVGDSMRLRKRSAFVGVRFVKGMRAARRALG